MIHGIPGSYFFSIIRYSCSTLFLSDQLGYIMSGRQTNNSKSKEESLETMEPKVPEKNKLEQENLAIQAAIEASEKLKKELRCEAVMGNADYVMIDLARIKSLGKFHEFLSFCLIFFFFLFFFFVFQHSVFEFRPKTMETTHIFSLLFLFLVHFLRKNPFLSPTRRRRHFFHPFQSHILLIVSNERVLDAFLITNPFLVEVRVRESNSGLQYSLQSRGLDKSEPPMIVSALYKEDGITLSGKTNPYVFTPFLPVYNLLR